MRIRTTGRVDWERASDLRWDGKTYQEIADALGCSVSAAYYAVNHGRIRLQRERQRPERQPNRRWSPERIRQAFRRFEAEQRRPPTWADLGTHGLPVGRVVQQHVGSFNEAMRLAGFTPRRPGRPKKRAA